MQITDVIVRKSFGAGPLCAVVSVILDGVLAVHDIKAVKKQDGSLMAVMPARADPFGRSRDVVHPVDDGFRKRLEQEIAARLTAE